MGWFSYFFGFFASLSLCGSKLTYFFTNNCGLHYNGFENFFCMRCHLGTIYLNYRFHSFKTHIPKQHLAWSEVPQNREKKTVLDKIFLHVTAKLPLCHFHTPRPLSCPPSLNSRPAARIRGCGGRGPQTRKLLHHCIG